jgi:hypothetical protein
MKCCDVPIHLIKYLLNMYLGTIYVSTKFRPNRTSNMAILEKQLNAVTPDHLQILIVGTSNKDT